MKDNNPRNKVATHVKYVTWMQSQSWKDIYPKGSTST